MKKNLLISASAAFTLAIGVSTAADAPDMKEGLWSIHTQSTDSPGNKKSEGMFSLCRSHAYDQTIRARAKAMKGCTVIGESLVPGKYSSETRCTIPGGTTIDSKGTTTFQSDTATHTENHSTYTPPLNGMNGSSMIMDQKWVSSCPAGMQPGDRMNADGAVMHTGKR